MKIVHIAAELAPIAKVGGLGDVALGLTKALLTKGHDVLLILPKYDTLDSSKIQKFEKQPETFEISFGNDFFENSLWMGIVETIPIVFIEPHHPDALFERGAIYGFPDDTARFVYFTLAALAFLEKKGWPDVVHLHDWHTSIAAPFLKALSIRNVLTIHNLSYPGHCNADVLKKTNLDSIFWESFEDPQYLETYNLLRGGITFADYITTVSPTYRNEILNTSLGGELRNTLFNAQEKFVGILNGIDFSFWNPEEDIFLDTHYRLEEIQDSFPPLSGKERIKNKLRTKFKLKKSDGPIVSVVTRLVSQKGPHLIESALPRILGNGGQFILVGSSFDPKVMAHFQKLKEQLKSSGNVHFELVYDEKIAHEVYAGSDALLVPSIFEPCGLTQLISMRYGTIPIVRKTGGLADTVIDGKNGFTFDAPKVEDLYQAIDHAFTTWYQHPEKWRSMMIEGMELDSSWNRPADAYLELYQN